MGTTEPKSRRRSLSVLLDDIRRCDECAAHLPHGTRPIMAATATSRIVLIGQAPGRKVHESGVPWQDQSGDTLRDWLGVDATAFYDPANFALVPMGFCYPGSRKSGDLPPRPECAPRWHPPLLATLRAVQLTLLIGQYAQAHYLQGRAAETLTETVRGFRNYLPQMIPLPHPSPRNRIWQARNRWFTTDLLPELRRSVQAALKP